MDFAAAGLLDGLKGKERKTREELLARLADEGFTLEELRAGVAEDRLVRRIDSAVSRPPARGVSDDQPRRHRLRG